MKRYLLDSDTLSYLQQQDSPFYTSACNRMSWLDDDDEVIVSILSLYEISYGISWGPKEDRDYLMQSIASIEKRFAVANLCLTGAEIFGELKSVYRKHTGIPSKTLKRDYIDILIASVAH
jgi:predicted nucleic acid-binding protein